MSDTPSEKKESAPPARIPFGAGIAARLAAKSKARKPAVIVPKPEGVNTLAQTDDDEQEPDLDIRPLGDILGVKEDDGEGDKSEPKTDADATATGSINVDLSGLTGLDMAGLDKNPTILRPSVTPPGTPIAALPVPPGEVESLAVALEPSTTSVGKDVTVTVKAICKDGSNHDVTAFCQLASDPADTGGFLGNVFTPGQKATVTISARYGESADVLEGKAVLTVIATGATAAAPKNATGALTLVPTPKPAVVPAPSTTPAPAAPVATPALLPATTPRSAARSVIAMPEYDPTLELKAKAEAEVRANERREKREKAEAEAKAKADAEEEARKKAVAAAKAKAEDFALERKRLEMVAFENMKKETARQEKKAKQLKKLPFLAVTTAIVLALGFISLVMGSWHNVFGTSATMVMNSWHNVFGTSATADADASTDASPDAAAYVRAAEAATVISVPVIPVPRPTVTLPPPPLPAGPTVTLPPPLPAGPTVTMHCVSLGGGRFRCIPGP